MDTIDNCRYQVLMIFLLAVFLVEVLCVAYLWIFLQVRQNSNHMAVGFLYLYIVFVFPVCLAFHAFSVCSKILSIFKMLNEKLSHEELKYLNLSETELLVLSACETAVSYPLMIGNYNLSEEFIRSGVKNVISTTRWFLIGYVIKRCVLPNETSY